MKWLLIAATALLLPCCDAHAIMTKPPPRPNQQGTGVKLQPFADAKKLADAGCGGITNKDPGVQRPTVAYRPGATVTVEWKLTIPHPADNLDSGVRIALHYDKADSFTSNILAGGVIGDPTYTPVAAGQANDASNALVTQTITLPAGKTCDYCTLQWIWAANQDGGSYVGCSDIAITTDGTLPNFATLPAQTGNILNGVPGQVYVAPGSGGGVGGPPPPAYAPVPSSGQAQTASGQCSGMSGSTGFVLGAFFACLLTPAGLWFYQKKQADKAGGAAGIDAVKVEVTSQTSNPAPPGGAPLPPGWTEATDPATNRVYYFHPGTGQSSWTVPTA
jgi:hypothetical protein